MRIVSCLILFIVCGCAEAQELSPEAVQFNGFAAAFCVSYDASRVAEFEKNVKGATVKWEGVVYGRPSPYGTSIQVAPIAGPTWQNGEPRVEAHLYNDKVYFPSKLRHGQRIRFTGRINYVSLSGPGIEIQSVSGVR